MSLSAPVLAAGGVMPTIALLFFFVLFVAIIAFVFAVPNSVWQRDAEIPLRRKEPNE